MATVPTFPSIDLSKLDLSKLDFGRLDLSKVKLPTVDRSALDTDKVVAVLRDAAYVVIGFGVLTVQQAQVRRRELVANLTGNPVVQQLGVTRTQVEDLVASLESRISQFDARLDTFEAKLDTAVEQLGSRLPEQAGTVLGQAHDVAKTARKQVRGLIRSAA
jgi:hypothetical protein